MRPKFQFETLLKSGVVVSLALICASAGFGQSLGDVARQERERQKQMPPAAHIYTNDDLQREHILVPEDQARIATARKNAAAQVAQARAALPASANSQAPAAIAAQENSQTLAAVAVQANSQTPGAASVTSVSAGSGAASTASIATLATELRARDAAQAIGTGGEISSGAAPSLTSSVESYGKESVKTSASRQPQAEQGPQAARAAQGRFSSRLAIARSTGKSTRSDVSDVNGAIAVAAGSKAVVAVAGKKAQSAVPATERVSVSNMPSASPRRAIPEWAPADAGVPDVITVEPGDSLWKLAKRYLGRGTRWTELAALNNQIPDANVLHVGEWICLPQGSMEQAKLSRPRKTGRMPEDRAPEDRMPEDRMPEGPTPEGLAQGSVASVTAIRANVASKTAIQTKVRSSAKMANGVPAHAETNSSRTPTFSSQVVAYNESSQR